MEAGEFPVFLLDADQPALPGAKQRRDAAEGDEHEPGDAREWSEVVQQDAADQAREQADRCADKSFADEVQRLKVIAGVNLPFLEAGLVLRDHVHEEIIDAHIVKIGGHP